MAADEQVVGKLEEEALKRKERLAALKRKQDNQGAKEDGPAGQVLPKPVFRSYKPQDEELQKCALPLAKPGDIESQVKPELEEAVKPPVVDELDLTNLAPRKPDFDLKRGAAKKLAKLERRTQKAIAELIRERLKDHNEGDILATVVMEDGSLLMSRTPSPVAQTSNYQDLLEKAKSSQLAIVLTRTPTKNGRSPVKTIRSPLKRNYSATDNLNTGTATANQLLLLPNKLNFTPTRFFRCHAKNQARDDTKTQIWSCAFAPDAENPIETLPLVATCGGDSFCIIDTEHVQVVKKYTTKEEAETFYCLAWFTLPLDNLGLSHVNYLAAAGTSGHLYLSHPEGNAVFEKFLATPSGVAIHSLIAHPLQPGTIICGTVDGRIVAWNIGSPRPPSYSTNPVKVFDLRIPLGGGVDNMIYWSDCDILLGAGENGLFAFNNFHVKQHNVVRLQFFKNAQSKTIDSLIKINPALAAAKQVYTGKIVLFSIDQIDFESSNPKPSKSKGCAVLDVQPLAELDWSGTDNFYMNMGIQLSGNLLACGDDKGTIWLYDLSEFDPESPRNMKPSQMIYWPQKLKDSNLTAYQQSKLSKIDIVINRVAVSSDGRTLVTVTSNNLVGIYKLHLK